MERKQTVRNQTASCGTISESQTGSREVKNRKRRWCDQKKRSAIGGYVKTAVRVVL